MARSTQVSGRLDHLRPKTALAKVARYTRNSTRQTFIAERRIDRFLEIQTGHCSNILVTNKIAAIAANGSHLATDRGASPASYSSSLRSMSAWGAPSERTFAISI